MTKLRDFQTAIIISEAGGPEVLQSAQMTLPQPKAHQVLIRIVAAGINRHDCLQRAAGIHHDGNPVPGLEASGVVVALGLGVTELDIGAPVMALLQGGGYAEYALADVALTMPVPEGLSMTEAAAVPEALFTAWWNFFFLMQLRPDEFALMHGGTSGVGHLALAGHAGASGTGRCPAAVRRRTGASGNGKGPPHRQDRSGCFRLGLSTMWTRANRLGSSSAARARNQSTPINGA